MPVVGGFGWRFRSVDSTETCFCAIETDWRAHTHLVHYIDDRWAGSSVDFDLGRSFEEFVCGSDLLPGDLDVL